VNNRYVTEWPCPDDHHFHTYEAHIPAALLRQGENRITLRMAYRHRIGDDRRRLALAVDRVTLEAH